MRSKKPFTTTMRRWRMDKDTHDKQKKLSEELEKIRKEYEKKSK